MNVEFAGNLSMNIDLKTWRERLLNQFGVASSVSAAVVALVGVLGLLKWKSPILGTIGVLAGFAPFVWAFFFSFSKKPISTLEHVGTPMSVDDLHNLTPPPLKVAVIGPQLAGKTTLKTKMAFLPPDKSQTETITAYICNHPQVSSRQIAILDGAGEKYAQQFKIAHAADVLLVVIDHNSSDTLTDVNAARVTDNVKFLRQVHAYLRENESPRKRTVIFLVNKRDLWKRTDRKSVEAMVAEYRRDIRVWKESNVTMRVQELLHSNDVPANIATLMNIIKDLCVDHAKAKR